MWMIKKKDIVLFKRKRKFKDFLNISEIERPDINKYVKPSPLRGIRIKYEISGVKNGKRLRYAAASCKCNALFSVSLENKLRRWLNVAFFALKLFLGLDLTF